MIPIVLVSIILAGLLIWALYAEVVPPRARFRPGRLDPSLTGADIRRHDFPVVIAGYDPRWVDAHLQQVAAIHDHLRRAAGITTDLPAADPSRVSVRDLSAQQALDSHRPGSVLDD